MREARRRRFRKEYREVKPLAKRRKHDSRSRPASSGGTGAAGDAIFKRRPSGVKSRRRPDGLWELVHPEMVLEMADDLAEVQSMIAAGEIDVAVDELRWLVEECRDAIEAHYLLGEIAFEERDFRLARGHFGYACELGWTALPAGGVGGKLSYTLPGNKHLLQSAKGAAYCLRELGKPKTALLVLKELISWDATDPLGAGKLLQQWGEPTA